MPPTLVRNSPTPTKTATKTATKTPGKASKASKAPHAHTQKDKQWVVKKVVVPLVVALVAVGAGILTAMFLFVPLMRNSCVLFDERCTSVVVAFGPRVGKTTTLLVTQPSTGFTYYFDGTYIYSYGNNLVGKCPTVLLSPSASSKPVVTQPEGLCAKYDTTGTTCIQGSPLVCQKPATYVAAETCDDPIQPGCVCAAPANTPEGWPTTCAIPEKYTCDDGATPTGSCCGAPVAACADPAQVCNRWAERGEGGKYACTTDGGVTDGTTKDFPFCCECSDQIKVTTYQGGVEAKGDIMEPVFVVDAATMRLLPDNNGIYCGKRLSLLLNNDFKDAKRRTIKINVPIHNNALNIYQIFDVLKNKKVFKLAR
jgi:hypothetical protein